MENPANLIGFAFGAMAGFLNGLVGVLSVAMFRQGHHPYFVAFYKCLFAAVLLVLLVLVRNRLRDFIAAGKNQISRPRNTKIDNLPSKHGMDLQYPRTTHPHRVQ